MSWKLFGLLLSLVGFLACSDDTAGSDKRPVCEFGERYNAIDNICVPTITETANNSSSNNVQNNASNNENNNTTNVSTNNGQGDSGVDIDMGTQTDMSVEPDMNTPDLPPAVCGVGTLRGRACSPNGDVLATADVTVTGIDCATGEPFTVTTRTDGMGVFEIADIPTGQHDLKIEIGSFSATTIVFIRAGETTDLTASADKICLDAAAVKIAVIGGAYDHVEGIIGDLNLAFDMKGDDASQINATTTFLQSRTAMAAYDIIFINCGDLYGKLAPFFGPDPRPVIAANLRDFVNQGGSLYVADWAAPWAELAFPEIMDMHGTDTVINEARVGYAPQTIMANVLSPALQAVLNSQTATIDFPHDPANNVINNNWAVLDGADATAVVHLSGTAKLCGPPSGGIFGNPCPASANVQTNAPLLLTWKAMSGGTVTYTSFHNERQGGVNQDMTKILRFLIFQL